MCPCGFYYLLLIFQLHIFYVGHKHVPRRMGDAELRLGVHHNVLRGHAAGPEHRCFAGVDGHGIAVIRVSQIMDADGFRLTGAASESSKSEKDLLLFLLPGSASGHFALFRL